MIYALQPYGKQNQNKMQQHFMDPTQDGVLPMARHPQQRKADFSEMPKLRVTSSRSENITYARGYQSSDPKTGNLKKPTKAPHEGSSAT